jgi:spore coat protein U-like protein
MRPLTLTFALALAAAAGSVHAQAGLSCTASMSSSTLSFGNIVVTTPAGTSALLGDFIVRCTNSDNGARNVRLRLAISAGASGSAAQRHMTRPGAAVPLLYNLYEDPAYTVVWAATTGGRPDEVLSVPGQGTAELRRQVFGRVPGNQAAVTPGSYADTLIATVRY